MRGLAGAKPHNLVTCSAARALGVSTGLIAARHDEPEDADRPTRQCVGGDLPPAEARGGDGVAVFMHKQIS